ncbi:hypothetical protein [Metamycoplasma neophronis]|uniref:Uncharacterized protein n=1 Tax=Metamycoplasma neophronis TaxID=872983 RepID=A0ABY2YZL2_9BACT|nr:hypothetical protein [Metamycoplasma neophronis]TPR53694.1 hypothetical protein FJR74_02215 [Metamycoplasma neophronis]
MNNKKIGTNYKIIFRESDKFVDPFNFEITQIEKALNSKDFQLTISGSLSFDDLAKMIEILNGLNNKNLAGSFFVIDNELAVLNHQLSYSEIMSRRFIDWQSTLESWFEFAVDKKIESMKYCAVLLNGSMLSFDIIISRFNLNDLPPYDDDINFKEIPKKHRQNVEFFTRLADEFEMSLESWKFNPNLNYLNGSESIKNISLAKFFKPDLAVENIEIKISKLNRMRIINDIHQLRIRLGAGDRSYPAEARNSASEEPWLNLYLEELGSYENGYNDEQDCAGEFVEPALEDNIIKNKRTKKQQQSDNTFNNESVNNPMNDPMVNNQSPEDFMNNMLEKMIGDIYKAAKASGIKDEQMFEYFDEAFKEMQNMGLPSLNSDPESSAKIREILAKIIAENSGTIVSSDFAKNSSAEKESTEEKSENNGDFGEEIN